MSTSSTLHEQRWTKSRPLGDERGEYPPGPWNEEPDKIQWIDAATDLDCLMVRNPLGAWCGYVGVPPSHPSYKLGYDEAADAADVEVHGGLTYAALCAEGQPEGEGICHVPREGREADLWWLGFDCAHSGDVMPGMLRYGGQFDAYETYRTLDWVQAEVTFLARQLAEVSA